jgi:hypothetical protein
MKRARPRPPSWAAQTSWMDERADPRALGYSSERSGNSGPLALLRIDPRQRLGSIHLLILARFCSLFRESPLREASGVVRGERSPRREGRPADLPVDATSDSSKLATGRVRSPTAGPDSRRVRPVPGRLAISGRIEPPGSMRTISTAVRVRTAFARRSGLDDPRASRQIRSKNRCSAMVRLDETNPNSEGRGNCTRSSEDAIDLGACTCDEFRVGLSEGCREDEALRELVGNWHRLTPSVRAAIMELARSGAVSGRGLEAGGIESAS